MNLLEEALLATKIENTFCPAAFIAFADVLRLWAHDRGGTEHWEWAEDSCREALNVLPTKSPLRLCAFRSLGHILIRRCEFLLEGRKSYIEEAVKFSVQTLAEDGIALSPMRHECIGSHAALLDLRYETFGDYRDLDEAIHLYRHALSLCPDTHVTREVQLLRLCWCLILRFQVSGDMQHLYDALTAGKNALKTGFPRSLHRSAAANNVAFALETCFETQSPAGSQVDIDEAVELRRSALLLSSWTSRSARLSNLANSLLIRFIYIGDQSDLEEGIKRQREAMGATSAKSIHYALLMANLACALMCRYKSLDNVDDINGAVDLLHRVKAMASDLPDNIPQERHLNLLGQIAEALNIRFEALGNAGDLDEAVISAETLVEIIPSTHKRHFHAVYQLAKAYLLRGQTRESLEDVERSVHLIETIPRDQMTAILAPDCLQNLNQCYMVKSRLMDDPENIIRTDILLELMELVPDDHRDQFQCSLKLAKLYLQRTTPYHSISSCVQYLARCVHDHRYDPRWRLMQIVPVLQDIEASEAHESSSMPPTLSITGRTQLVDVYAAVVALLPHIAFFGLDLSARFRYLARGQSIATVAASHAIAIGQPKRALEILEQGRAVFWTHALRLRSQFDDVPDHIRQQLISLSKQLEQSDTIPVVPSDFLIAESASARRHQQTKQFTSLVEHVRTLPGLERFMLHEEAANLSKVSDEGPVVVLVPSAAASHAIILRRGQKPVDVTLPALTEAWSIECSINWRVATMESRAACGDRAMTKANRFPSPANGVLEGLWIKLVWPILSVLQYEVA
jgi:tetratricopeptide (TPR) repeat protein